MAQSLRFYGDGVSFWVVFSQSFWLRVLPGGAHLFPPRWMPARRILGGGWTCGVSFWLLLNSSGWWWLISSLFLTKTSCHKITDANGYWGAWPGWAVSVSVLPLTIEYKGKSKWHRSNMVSDLLLPITIVNSLNVSEFLEGKTLPWEKANISS